MQFLQEIISKCSEQVIIVHNRASGIAVWKGLLILKILRIKMNTEKPNRMHAGCVRECKNQIPSNLKTFERKITIWSRSYHS